MKKKHSLREIWKDDKIVWTAIITIGILFFPTGLIHEAGHILVCVSNGSDYTFTIADIAFNVHCSDSPQPIELYWIMGGMFGLVASVVLLASKCVRTNKGVFIGVVTAFDHYKKRCLKLLRILHIFLIQHYLFS